MAPSFLNFQFSPGVIFHLKFALITHPIMKEYLL